MLKVKLTSTELLTTAQIGVMRRINGIMKRARDGVVITEEYGNPTIGWNRDIHGALGEYAFAKAMNLPWHNPTSFSYDEQGHKLPDVGKWEVRAIEDQEKGLLIRHNDIHPCALVLGRDIDWVVLGWTDPERGRGVGRLIQTPGRPDCWVVPKSHLVPFDQYDIGGATP